MERYWTICTQALFLVVISMVLGHASHADYQTGAARLLEATGIGQRHEGILDWQIETQNTLCPPDELGDGEKDTFSIDRAVLRAKYVEVLTGAFTEDQIADLVAFFTSPLGSRYVGESSSIETRGRDVIDESLAHWRRDSLVALGRPVDSLYLLGLPETRGLSDLASSEVSDEHQTAAALLFEVSPWRSALSKSFQRGLSAYEDLVVASEDLPTTVQERLARTSDWDHIVEELVTIVARSFSAAELRDLRAFFSSPAGMYFASEKEELDARLLEETNKVLGDRQRKMWEAGC